MARSHGVRLRFISVPVRLRIAWLLCQKYVTVGGCASPQNECRFRCLLRAADDGALHLHQCLVVLDIGWVFGLRKVFDDDSGIKRLFERSAGMVSPNAGSSCALNFFCPLAGFGSLKKRCMTTTTRGCASGLLGMVSKKILGNSKPVQLFEPQRGTTPSAAET